MYYKNFQCWLGNRKNDWPFKKSGAYNCQKWTFGGAVWTWSYSGKIDAVQVKQKLKVWVYCQMSVPV